MGDVQHAAKLVLAVLVVGSCLVMVMCWNLVSSSTNASHEDSSMTWHGAKAILNVGARPATNATNASADVVFAPRRIRFLTLADDARPNICHLAAAIYQQGNVLEVLGWDQSDTFFDGTSCGARCKTPLEGAEQVRFGQEKKLYWLLHYFEHKPDLHDDDLVLFTDAWDVIVNGDTTTLTDLFLRHTKHARGVIFNGEPACGDSFTLPSEYGDYLRRRSWRVQLERDQNPRLIRGDSVCNAMAAKTLSTAHIPGPNWSLGSGGILGDVRSFRSILRKVHQIRREQEELFAKDPHRAYLFQGDQILFQLAYLQSPEINVKVDASGEIFFVISHLVADGDFDEFSPAKGCTRNYMAHGLASVYAWNRIAPVFFHFPGDYKEAFWSCAAPTSRYRESRGVGQYMFDVDRSRQVPVADVCPTFV
ncbi:hypothetical protein SPRG_17258 [Saprolegnia parasitica CBS 223.65]|uniref:Uncharacterized protein n=1 Tax=Saprolegnia parasitica (strain CBS 223.65) TaxID=695850 RepID=A0A067BQT8_SAPPC|nr:hypothetical protein SPRG_17258 [Saprolegnia parasitica CBS 223.65]KDO17047.1 hypothetical protein SPRG_17258 [Saprolegnia parasitica CBS 223.65]|eukprot:XP_012212245.1 hypothetical protein SPRG_17258 [Saprolegnia parasitica CBS 223.65]